MKINTSHRANIFLQLFLLISTSVFTIYAAPGDLDPTFSQDGKVLTSVGKGRDEAWDAAQQADGKIVVVGTSGGNVRHISMARYNADGSLDTTFGTGGKVVLAYPVVGTATEVGIQSTGKIVVAGYRLEAPGATTQIPVVGRFNADGSPDTSFGANGFRDLIFSLPTDLVIQPDDKIVLSGSQRVSGPNVFSVMRLNSDGTPDTNFGIDGKANVSIGSGSSYANAVDLQSDGKIVLAGYGSNGADSDFALARFTSDGILDTTFDGDGRLIFPVGAGTDQVNGVKIQADGKIVAAGSVQVSAPSLTDFGVVRLNSDGSFDNSFDGDGKIVVPVGATNDEAYRVGFQSDGKIIVSGNSFQDFAAIRLLTNGTLDTSFGTGGKVILPIPNTNNNRLGETVIQSDDRLFLAGYAQDSTLQADYALFQLSASGMPLFSKLEEFDVSDDFGQDVAVQADGKIVVVGYSSATGVSDVALVRYNTDGSLDTTFGTGGKVVFPVNSVQRANCIAIQPDGKIVVGGAGEGSAFGAFAIYRFNPDGSIDTSFDGDGKFIATNWEHSEAFDIALQPDGKIVAAGNITIGFAVFRVNPNGGFDTSFASTGYRTLGGSFANQSFARAVAVQTDGKIIVGGHFNSTNGAWARLNPDGSIEGSQALIAASIFIDDVAIQPDGKILFGGTRENSMNTPRYNMAVTRYNADKTIDSGFGNGFTAIANFGVNSFGTALVVQSGGQIVIGGYVDATTAARDFALARFTSNGVLDTGFGSGGKVVTPMTAYEDRISGLALQADGKIVAAGSAYNSIDWDFAVARYDGGASTVPSRTPFDYDGDGKADISVFRPTENKWYILQSSNYALRENVFGLAGDVPVPADFDGDGKTDVAIWRPSAGAWWYLSSISGQQVNVNFGQAGDIPRPSDFDGDGKTDFVLYRPSNSVWYRMSAAGVVATPFAFGIAEDKPLIGDFDGDGKSDPAVFRPSSGDWWYASSVNGQFAVVHWGASGDIPTPADVDADGKTDFMVYRPSNGGWYILRSGEQNYTILQFGIAEDKPVVADYDGDGKADVAVFRPSTGTWYLLQTTSGFGAVQWGNSSDIPTENAFLP